MALTWVFEPILGAFIVTVEGDPTLDEFFAALDGVLGHPKAGPGLKLLIDQRRIPPPTPEMVRDGLLRLRTYVPQLPHSELVLVVEGKHAAGVGRIGELVLDGEVQIDIFNDMASAVASLVMEQED